MSAHTPGPWIQNPGPDGGSEDHKRANRLYVRLGTGSANAVVERQNVFGKVTDEDLANARLVAAAPDLIGVLKTISGMLGNVDHSQGNGPNAAKMRGQLLNDFRSMADEVIRKATTEDGK